MKAVALVLPLLLVAALAIARDDGSGLGDVTAPAPLRAPSAFAHLTDNQARARAMFVEIGRVLQHPRCSNCHPVGDRPLQGDDGTLHQPMAVRGSGGMGVPGMRCPTCHASENVVVTSDYSVPGHPNWHLAPRSMSWAGRSLAEICEQIKDPARNGGKDLAALVHHMAEDGLVGWAWNPGVGRETPPGSQRELGELTQAWVNAGASCP